MEDSLIQITDDTKILKIDDDTKSIHHLSNSNTNNPNIYNTDPYVATIDDFLSTEECEYIINKAKTSLRESVVSGRNGGVASKGRSSKTTWLCFRSDPKLRAISERSASILKTSWKHFEQLQIVKYEEGQEYRYHYDAYNTSGTCERGKRCTAQRGQRLNTILFYLTDVEEGGETGFRDIKDLNGSQLKVSPKKGRALIFQDVITGTDQQHPKSLHAGFPVSKGEKWIANFWHRELPFDKQKPPYIPPKVSPESSNVSSNVSSLENKNNINSNSIPFYSNLILSNNEHNDYHKNYDRLYTTIGRLLSKIKTHGCLYNKNLLLENFNKDKLPYKSINNIFIPEVYEIIKEYYVNSINDKDFPFGDRQSQRFKARNDKIARILNYDLVPLISKITGCKMEASYTYLSAYVNDASLPAHVDRDHDCEFTCSFLISKDTKNISWPIYLEKDIKKHKTGRAPYTIKDDDCYSIECEENGLICFDGVNHNHFRHPYKGDYAYFLLLHYFTAK